MSINYAHNRISSNFNNLSSSISLITTLSIEIRRILRNSSTEKFPNSWIFLIKNLPEKICLIYLSIDMIWCDVSLSKHEAYILKKVNRKVNRNTFSYAAWRSLTESHQFPWVWARRKEKWLIISTWKTLQSAAKVLFRSLLMRYRITTWHTTH